MKTTKLILVAIAMSVFAPQVSAASAVQVWQCNAEEGKTQDDIMAVSKAWLDAAKTMEGGEELEVYVGFPMAGTGDSFSWVMISKNLESWGKFMDGYDDSVAAKADVAFAEVASCPGSTLEASYKVE